MAGVGGVRIDKNDLKKLMKDKGEKAAPVKEKEPLTLKDKLVRAVTLLIVIVYFVLLFFGKYFIEGDNLYLNSLDIFSGIEEPIKPIRIASLAILTLSISKVLRIIIDRMTENKAITKRTGVAIIELLSNMVKYAAFLILVFLILNAAGVDTTELLAGLGILSLILGLGVTSLVEDVVAGIFIIAERLFDVGDIVVVDDFRGTILSIGIRSTQIEDEGGDILILRNSAIESLVNMTNRMSYAICEIPIDPEVSLEEVEAVIEEGLKEMEGRIESVEEGPMYLGVAEMTAKGITLDFVAICSEDNKYYVQRSMLRELRILFEKNNIPLGEFAEMED